MSAFLVSSRHVSAIVDYARRTCGSVHQLGFDLPTLDDPQTVGRLLFTENLRSVDCRYPSRDGDAGDVPAFTWHEGAADELTAVQILKLLDCLEYQSCECSNYYSTRAWEMLQALRLHVIDTLPGYDDADWCI